MPEIISCPDCGRKLRVPENLLGKKVKCPGCQGMFTAAADGGAPAPPPPPPKPAAPKPARRPALSEEEGIEETPRSRRPALSPPEEDEDDRPRRRRAAAEEEEEDEDYPRRDEEDYDDEGEGPTGSQVRGWRKVSSGLLYLNISIFVRIAYFVVAICGFWMVGTAGLSSMSGARSQSQAMGTLSTIGTGLIVVGVIAGLIWLAAHVLQIVGHVFCLSVPAKRGSSVKSLALATLCLVVAWVALSYLATMISLIMGPGFGFVAASPASAVGGGIAALVFSVAASLCWLISCFTFLVFLRGVCMEVGNRRLASVVRTYTIVFSSLVAATVAVLGLMFAIVGTAFYAAFGGGVSQTGANAMGGGLLVGSCLLGLLGLAFFGILIWFIVLLFQVRGAIGRYLERA